MNDTDPTFIETLIKRIEQADQPESVTPEMVAEIFSYLNSLSEGLRKITSSLKTDLDTSDETIKSSLGTPGGIATLEYDGQVPMSQLPVGQLKDVVEFGGMVSPVFASVIQSSTLGEGDVVFMAPTGTFVFQSKTRPAKYYANWGGAEVYGEPSDKGRVPVKGKLYVDVSANKQYRWDGSKLVATGSHLELGDAAGTAFAGDQGKQLRADVDTLAKRVDGVVERMPVMVFDGIITSEQDLDRLPAGFYFHTGHNRFGYSEGTAQSWDPDSEHNGNPAEDRASYLFRCGARLFHFVDDSMFEFVDAERLDEMRNEIIDEVMTRLQGLAL